MSLTKRVGLLTGTAAVSVTGVAMAGSQANPNEDLRERLATAEARIAELETASNDSWLSDRRANEVRSLVQDVLADADTRASLLQGGAMVGHEDGHFYVGTSDGSYRLNIRGQLQARFVYNNQDNSPGTPGVGDGDDDRWGFENTRTKLIFDGHIVDPSWEYKVEGNFSESGGTFGLQDAYIRHHYENGMHVTVGQMKVPLLYEEIVDSSMQLAVERSVVNELYTGGRVQGIWVGGSSEQFRWGAGLTDGAGSANTSALTEDTEFAVSGRIDVKLSGDWSQFDDFTSMPGSANAWRVGGAAHYERAEYGTGLGTGVAPSFNDAELENLTLTADVQGEFDGANVFGALIYRNLDTDVAGAADFDQIGIIAQGGFYFQPTIEGFVRYEWSDIDTTGLDDISILTIGVNKYFAEHAAKWTTDIGFGFDSVPTSAGSIANWRADGTDDGQIVFRTQWQLLF